MAFILGILHVELHKNYNKIKIREEKMVEGHNT